MEPTETGGAGPEETPSGQQVQPAAAETPQGAGGPEEALGEAAAQEAPGAEETVEMPASGGPPPPGYPPYPTAGKPKKSYNWTLIALIAVSCVAVLLLAATIALAVSGHHRGFAPHEFHRFREMPRGPMMRDFDGSWPGWKDNGQQSQPQQSAPQQSSPGT